MIPILRKLWFWLLIIAVILFIIAIASYSSQIGNYTNINQVSRWIIAVFVIAIIIFVISLVLYCYEIYRKNRQSMNISTESNCKNGPNNITRKVQSFKDLQELRPTSG